MRWNFCLRIVLSLSLYGLVAALKKYYTEDLCSQNHVANIELNRYSSIILTSIRTEQNDCNIFVKPRRGASIVLSIKSYNLSKSDQLIVEDSDFHKIQLLGRREFFDEKKYMLSEGRFSIHFKPDSANPPWKTYFEFVLTQTHGGPCGHDEFECDNKECINSSLKCDAQNHCGDRSDQKKCGRQNDGSFQTKKVNTPRVWAISIVVGGSILAIVVIVFLALVIRGIVMKKKEEKETKASMSTAEVNVPPPVAPNDAQPHPSYWIRIRNSFRSTKNPQAPNMGHHQMSEVPSMYPQIPSPTAPSLSGVDNLDFKVEE